MTRPGRSSRILGQSPEKGNDVAQKKPNGRTRGIPARMKKLERRQRRIEKKVNLFATDAAEEIDDLTADCDEVKSDINGIKHRLLMLENWRHRRGSNT